MIDHALAAATLLAWLSIGRFILVYSRLTWERSYMGRSVMGGAVGTWTIASFAVAKRIDELTPGTYWQSLRLPLAAGWLIVAVVYCWKARVVRHPDGDQR